MKQAKNPEKAPLEDTAKRFNRGLQRSWNFGAFTRN
jgi:hypothetical protein